MVQYVKWDSLPLSGPIARTVLHIALQPMKRMRRYTGIRHPDPIGAITGPAVVRRIFPHRRPHRVEFNVALTQYNHPLIVPIAPGTGAVKQFKCRLPCRLVRLGVMSQI
jgi:hypothetical protein